MNSFAETRYVSDDVFVYIHSGPSLEYRIIGTLKVGTQVETLKYNQSTKFVFNFLTCWYTGNRFSLRAQLSYYGQLRFFEFEKKI